MTLIDAIVAMAILAVFCLAGFWGFSKANSDIVSAGRMLQAYLTASQAERVLRREIGSIHYPLWSQEPKDIGNQKNVSIPFVDGDPAKVLTLAASDGYLVITGSTGSLTIKGLDELEFASLKDPEGRIIGLLTNAQIGTNKLRIAASFGRLPIRCGVSP